MKQIFHPYTEWECFLAGMYSGKNGIDIDEGRAKYAGFLRNTAGFASAMNAVSIEWPKSCEHFLTNYHINRIAWLGQSSACYATGLSRAFRSGFYNMTATEQGVANMTAKNFLIQWTNEHKGKGSTIHRDVEGEGLFAGHS